MSGMIAEGIIEIDETLSSSCTNSEIEVSSDLKELGEPIAEDIKDGTEQSIQSDPATTPDSEEPGKPSEEPTGDEESDTGKVSPSISENIKDNENMAVKKPRLKYSREELLTLMHYPLSREWPSNIDPSFQKMQGTIVKIDLDRLVKYTQETKRSGQPFDDSETITAAAVIPEKVEMHTEHKKPKDPRERIKQEEQDGIVLSPQRRSFGTGCRVQHQMQPSYFQNKRSSDIMSDVPPSRDIHRDMPSRRIGSGRIIRREDADGMGGPPDSREYRKEFNETELRHRDWRMKNEGRYDKYRDDRTDKRRPYYENERMQQPERRDKRRNVDSRRLTSHYHEEEAPEWFTSGPSSQHEFIELVGFDEEDKDSRVKPENNRKNVMKKKPPTPPPVAPEPEEPPRQEVVKPPGNDDDVMQFNIDNIILGDFLDIGSDEVYHSSGKSRLKQFFQDRSSPTEEVAPGRSSGESNPIGALFGFNGAAHQVPTTYPAGHSTSRPFPSAAAIMTSSDSGHGHNSVADLFNQNGSLGRLSAQLNNPPSVNDLLMGGKGQALQDIEANLCTKPEQPKSRDLNRNADQKGAFNQFLLNGGLADEHHPKVMQHRPPTVVPNVPNNAPNEGDLISMMMKNNCQLRSQMNGQQLPTQNHMRMQMPYNNSMTSSVRQTSPTFMGGGGGGGQPNCDAVVPRQQLANHLSVPHAAPTNQEMILKLMHQQQKKQAAQPPQLLHPGFQPHDPIKQLIGGGGGGGPNANASSQQHHHQHQQQGVLHPDVQMLLQRLAGGHVTESQLLAQLASPSVAGQQRDAIATVLKLLHSHHATILGQRAALTPSPTPPVGGGLNLAGTPTISLSPRVASPNPEVANMLAAPHVMSQRVSPLMFNTAMAGNPRRPPSHQELVAHTQSILQKALIKQELEKAKEKHRKREHERIKSPNPSVNVLSSIVNSMGDSRNGGKSQSPLAFTPTSVMRKMTEKDRNSIQDMNRHPAQAVQNYYQNNPQILQGNALSMQAKKEMVNKNFEQQKTALSMAGHVMSQNRHSMPISRHNTGHHQQTLSRQNASMHGQQTFGNITQHSMQQAARMQGPPPPSSLQQMIAATKNNNGYLAMQSDNIPQMAQMGGMASAGINLANLFGRDIVTQAQNGKLPDLPGSQAFSLEEIEKVQQSQANQVAPACFKYV